MKIGEGTIHARNRKAPGRSERTVENMETNSVGIHHKELIQRAAASSALACSTSLDTLLRELHGAVEGMMEIVEGCRGERWTANGRRLVDTPEWYRLYVARCAVNHYEANKE